MADVAKSGNPSLSTPLPCSAVRITGLLAGEALAAGDTVYVKSDGFVWRTNGTAGTAPALYTGIVFAPSSVGEACTPYFGVCANYGSGLTPGARYYISATAGAIADAATTGGTIPIGFAIDTTQIYFFAPNR